VARRSGHVLEPTMLTQVQGSSTDEQKEKEKRKMAIVPKEKWILVEAPKSMEEDFEVVTMGEVKTAVNEFIVQVSLLIHQLSQFPILCWTVRLWQ